MQCLKEQSTYVLFPGSYLLYITKNIITFLRDTYFHQEQLAGLVTILLENSLENDVVISLA